MSTFTAAVQTMVRQLQMLEIAYMSGYESPDPEALYQRCIDRGLRPNGFTTATFVQEADRRGISHKWLFQHDLPYRSFDGALATAISEAR